MGTQGCCRRADETYRRMKEIVEKKRPSQICPSSQSSKLISYQLLRLVENNYNKFGLYLAHVEGVGLVVEACGNDSAVGEKGVE